MQSIQLNNVSKIYSNGVKALDDVSFTLNKGEFIAVMGSSGSGKSTLLQIAGLLDSCTEGNVLINEKDVSELNEKSIADIRRDSIGFVFQAFHLNPHLRIYENVMIPLFINPKYRNKGVMKEKAEELLAKVGLSHRSNHYPNEVSGGEQQRTAIARALSNDPDFILADEPTGNLDSKNENMIFQELKKLTDMGKGVLVVSHNESVLNFADKVFTMKDGVLNS